MAMVGVNSGSLYMRTHSLSHLDVRSHPHTLRILRFCMYKKLSDVRGRISHGYISLLSADKDSLKWPAATVYRVSNFMAAYGTGRSPTRDTTDRRLDGLHPSTHPYLFLRNVK